jgi:NAD+ synthase/NAD+ synthase (glutamine-hydrolysing)
MRIRLVPLNPTVGDFDRNTALLRASIAHAASTGVELLVFPELAMTGYPPRDLLLQRGFVERAREAVLSLASDIPAGMHAIIGTPWRPAPGSDPLAEPGSFVDAARATNSLAVLRGGELIARYDKRLLPDYDVFDEPRYFRPGHGPVVIDVAGRRVGLAICEDLWRGDDARFGDRYAGADPLIDLKEAGAQLVVVPSASPFVAGKSARQSAILGRACERVGLPIAGVNALGANDDLIFDGHAAVYAPPASSRPGTNRAAAVASRLLAASAPFVDAPLDIDLPADAESWSALPEAGDPYLDAEPMHLLFAALALGVRDYAEKSRFAGVTLGVSGGIDSALPAVIAAAAIGGERVLGVRLPSRYSSDHSLEDAAELCERLGAAMIDYPIAPAHDALERTLGDAFAALGLPDEPDITEENVQSRIRGLAMMAISNKSGRLLLTTGNKSEHAVGYSTLYGDQNGGLAPIADLLKTEVYALACFINERYQQLGFASPPIPQRTIDKPPSAELRPGQTDQDTLPPYDTLDDIIAAYVDERLETVHIAARGHDPALVDEIVRKIDAAEFKRFQLCVSLKVRPRAFGPGRRMPIVAARAAVGSAMAAMKESATST